MSRGSLIIVIYISIINIANDWFIKNIFITIQADGKYGRAQYKIYVTKLFCPRRHKNEYHLTNQTEGKKWRGLTVFQKRRPTMPDMPFLCRTVVVIKSGRYSYMFSFHDNFYINLLMLQQRPEAVCGEKMNFSFCFFSIVVVFSRRKKKSRNPPTKKIFTGGLTGLIFKPYRFVLCCAFHN